MRPSRRETPRRKCSLATRARVRTQSTLRLCAHECGTEARFTARTVRIVLHFLCPARARFFASSRIRSPPQHANGEYSKCFFWMQDDRTEADTLEGTVEGDCSPSSVA